MKEIYKIKSLVLLSICLLCMDIACKKAVDVGPSKVALNDTNVYTTDGGAQSVVSGLYMRMANTSAFYNGSSSMSLLMGLSSDELVSLNNQAYSPAYTNNYTANLAPPFWTEIYREIFICNLAIKGITESAQITGTVKQQLVGELKFIRAFNYFYAVNLYGDVPLTLTDNYLTNNVISRTPSAEVYKQIVLDLTDAQSTLPDNKYVDGSGAVSASRVRPNRQVATAMLARVYLYLQDWKNAEVQAGLLISNNSYTLEPDLNQVFLKTSREVIWQLQPVSTLYSNTADAFNLVINSNNLSTAGQLPLSSNLTSAFEAGDKRAVNWVGHYTTTTVPVTTYNYAFKYKVVSLDKNTPGTEYPTVFRLAEQYLIRAEARARQNNLNGASDDLFVIRQRAGLGRKPATDQATMLLNIENERKFELFTEWGHRWFDLKRTGRLNAVMSVVTPAKGGTWQDYKQLFPISFSDIQADPNLKQTIGY